MGKESNEIKDRKKIVLTGGHAGATAYALVKSLRKNTKFDLDITFIGAKSALEGIKTLTLEQNALPQLGVNFIGITAARLQRKLTLHGISSILKLPVGFISAFLLMLKLKPDVVVSFGGYVAFPVVLSAYLLNIPIIIHEQTSVYGLANRLSQFMAKKICLSRSSSLVHFDNKKTVITGNPVDERITKITSKNKLTKRPVLFVTGGSRGSEVINENVHKLVSQLVKKFDIVHQVGEANLHKYKSFKGYEVYGQINPNNWPDFITKADIIISRAGANIVSEILMAKRLSILIPIPWSYMDEQTQNAHYASTSGGVVIIKQNELTPSVLNKNIEYVIKNWNRMTGDMAKFKSEDTNASDNLTGEIFKLL